jgi:branched-subunit amino acid ABC-type transport system permease component
MTPALFVQSTVIGLSIGSIYILMALGLTLMFGMMHIINFAHGAIYMLGAFVIYYVFFQWGAPYFAAFVLAMLVLGAFGYLVERSIYRPIKGGIEPTLVALLAPPCCRPPAIRSSAPSTNTCRRFFRGRETCSA